ncbi:reverse transcriptase-like protein [Virgibacillus alimentarius]|uniref:Ribonuclease HI n=1 Tax=Virgibacillus alimentarius TaxID=698769 RepID=A0ABS4SAC3_9BACI|nr:MULTISPECIES: reverse transcriptase-like protein [Virgibacillus]MBP2258462.1 ribonuclease HI [Virgibacillus alimentarius]HLR67072.1 reverse transcriptase-like protein [Virgibacillus sp.]
MIEVYTDGASSGNPGKSGAGVYMKANGNIYEYAIPLGVRSNHEAEFQAVIEALKICQEHFPDEILSFRSDSRIVVDTVEKDFTKNKTFLPLLEEIKKESNSFPYFFIKWISESHNKHADELARKAIRI